MLKPLIYIFLFFLLFAGLALPVSTASRGDTNTYLPLVLNDNHMGPPHTFLYKAGNGGGSNIFVSAPPPGNSPIQLTTLTAPAGIEFPTFAPDGNHIVYRRLSSNASQFNFWVIGANGTPHISLFNESAAGINLPQWGEDSRTLAYTLLYTGYGANQLYTIDIESRTPLTLATDVTSGPVWDLDGFGLYYAAINGNGTTDDVRRVEADGTDNQLILATNGRTQLYGVVSDGRILLRIYANGSDDLYLLTPDTGALTPLTTNTGTETWVSVEQGGQTILFSRQSRIYAINLMGTEQWSFGCQMAICTLGRFPVSWSPDGQEVGFTVERQTGNGLLYDLYLAPTDGSQGNPILLLADRAGRHGFSQDGRYLAYEQDPPSTLRLIQVLDRATQLTTALTSDTNDLYFYGWRPLP